MDRRQFLASTGAAALTLAAEPGFAKGKGAGGDKQLHGLLDAIFNDGIARSPEFATALGLDKGKLAHLRSELSPATAAERRSDLARNQRWLGKVRAVPEVGLSEAGKRHRALAIFQLQQRSIAAQKFDIGSVQRPYPIFQQGGSYFEVPDFLTSTHPVGDAADAEAYLARLSAFARQLDEDSAEQRAQAARGFVAPGWSLNLTLGQIAKLRSPAAAETTMAQYLGDKTKAKGIAGDWQGRAAKIIEGAVYPALDRQIALMTELRGKTRAGDGAWRLTRGDEIYAAALAQATTTSMTPEQVHSAGLAQVAEISGQLDAILKQAGLTQGSVAERLTELNKRPEQLYPNTDEGRKALIDSLNAGVADMWQRLPRAFADIPRQPLEIRRVPVEIQDGASNGYYNRASLDGSRPAIYWINLKDTGDWPKYSLPALTYHEGTPGHHLQGSYAQLSGDLPMLLRNMFLSAYGEGWALYAEQLADELGAFSGIERAGYLQSFLFRAARLVVDTGIHAKRWSREQATDYMVHTTGFARPRCQREVERYCTQIGQACSYKIGHMAWLKQRQKAEAALGTKFSLHWFHEVLKEGVMPLSMLDMRIDQRIKERLAKG
ncbi:DUF885 family protein [Novosphingobium sp.]|uniref:DUF885 domain-containing protein n=1 Tax=Novosphingobium sp. TaxID=1874826 RepID=UPI0025D7D98F|nr:DUF885 family protein [Novosphingobium sp.]MCC6925733.1 DUF885 family protein [Novosphingobium sp.]